MVFTSSLFNKVLFKHIYPFILRKSHTEVVSSVKNEVSKKHKLKKASFMKNIFVGVVDTDILYFPEVDLPETESSRIKDEHQVETKAVVSEEKSFKKLLKSGILSMGFPKTYGGKPCNSTCLLKEIEKLYISPVEAFLLETQYSLIIENLQTYGSELQKTKYLPDLMSGMITGAFALHEDASGSDPASIASFVVPTSSDGTYVLNGEKSWITNANDAKFFIIFAQFKDISRVIPQGELTAFIVDRESPGVVLTKQKSELNECEVYHLKLENVSLSRDNILGNIGDGYQLASTTLETNKFIFILCILNNIRKMASDITVHISKVDRFLRPLRENELVQHNIAKIMTTLYAIESTLYLLAGIKDLYEMDTALESVIVQNILYSHGLSIVNNCINLIGIQAFEKSISYDETLRNLLLLFRSFISPETLKLYISLKGLEYAGQNIGTAIFKMRNPLDFPGAIFKRILYTNGQVQDRPKLNKGLYNHFHPSLKISADQLEYSIYRLQYSVEILLSQHGTESVQRQIHLTRMSEIASDIFSMVAVLARASRAYCTGIRFADQDIIVANAWCQETRARVKMNVNEIVEGKIILTDYSYLNLASHILQNKGYFFTHPQEKNID